MKKLLFAAYSLDLGGIEKALITLTNTLQEKGYDITIVLEKKQGIFLKELNNKIKVIEYAPNESTNILKRKVVNLYKRIKFILQYKNKFDFSACFATYSLPASFVSRVASKNTALWVHTDYMNLYKGNEKEFKIFFDKINYNKFKHIVMVSQNARKNFIKIFPDEENKILVCNNLVNYDRIISLSKEKIDLEKNEYITTFLNIGRHDEESKKLTRLIEATEMLAKDRLKFKVLFVGEGNDTRKYKDLVKEKNLDNYILFVGAKENPYPYFRISDCVILTSEYEGYPVVFLESFVLNKPIITTKVSDYQEVEGKYGYVTTKEVEDIYEKMKLFIKEGYQIKKRFNPEKYNNEMIKKIEKIF